MLTTEGLRTPRLVNVVKCAALQDGEIRWDARAQAGARGVGEKRGCCGGGRGVSGKPGKGAEQMHPRNAGVEAMGRGGIWWKRVAVSGGARASVEGVRAIAWFTEGGFAETRNECLIFFRERALVEGSGGGGAEKVKNG